jgi:hypothetical protein
VIEGDEVLLRQAFSNCCASRSVRRARPPGSSSSPERIERMGVAHLVTTMAGNRALRERVFRPASPASATAPASVSRWCRRS